MKLIAFLVTLAAAVLSTEAYMCYYCTDCATATGQLRCDDVLGCGTIVTDDGKVTRSCGNDLGRPKSGCKTTTFDGVSAEACLCQGDWCNGPSFEATTRATRAPKTMAPKTSTASTVTSVITLIVPVVAFVQFM